MLIQNTGNQLTGCPYIWSQFAWTYDLLVSGHLVYINLGLIVAFASFLGDQPCSLKAVWTQLPKSGSVMGFLVKILDFLIQR